MLNRVYIAIGILLILVMAAAFVVPRFYDWNVYRDRVEAIAAEALGTDVAIRGDLSFTLLPQPQMTISDIVVGDENAPLLEVERADAHLNLMEFLRDIYAVQRLNLDGVKLHLTLDERGGWRMPIQLPQDVPQGNVSIEDAVLSNAEVVLADQRSGESWRMQQINGHLSAAGLRGPFAFEATGTMSAQDYTIRLTSSELNPKGNMRLSAFVAPIDRRFSLDAEGVLYTGGARARFEGESDLRVKPQRRDENDVRGDLTLKTQIALDAEALTIEEFNLVPDENRAGTRLVGNAELSLGAERQFDALISGGVVPLIPQDALRDRTTDPYALVELLINLPPPPEFDVAGGNLQVDIGELGLGDFSLRDVAADLALSGGKWQVQSFTTRLAGDSTLSMSGELIEAQGHAAFDGAFSFTSERLDALARGWRSFTDDNPLFGATAQGNGRLRLSSSGVNIAAEKFRLDDDEFDFVVDWREEKARRLVFNADFGQWGAQSTERLLAFLPEVGSDQKFNQTFPLGRFKVNADQLVFDEMPLRGATFSGKWSKAGIEVDDFTANDVAGVSIQSSGILAGTLEKPQLSGTARLDVQPSADVSRWAAFWPGGMHPKLVDILTTNRPARYEVELMAPQNQAQKISVEAVNADLKLDAAFDFGEGIFNAATAPSVGAVFISARHGAALFDGLQLDGGDFEQSTPAQLSFEYQGTLSNSIEAEIGYEAGSTELGYKGSLIVSDLSNLRGRGTLQGAVSDMEGFSTLVGLNGLFLPDLKGSATLKFTGQEKYELTDIKVRAADEDVTGQLSMSRLGDSAVYSGGLRVSRLSVDGLAEYLGGPTAMLNSGAQIWPDGPFNIAANGRKHRGRIDIDTPLIMAGDRPFLTGVSFDLSWTANENRIRNLLGARGEGEVGLDVTICCYGSEAQKQLNGRFRLDGVALSDVLVGPASNTLSGFIDGAGRFSTRGGDFAQMITGLGGEGSFSVVDFAIEGVNSEIFAKIGAMDNLTNLSPEAFKAQIDTDLAQGRIDVPEAEGLFTVASGKMLLRNFSVEDARARLFGDLTLDLSQFGLSGDWMLTPTQAFGDGSVLSENAAQIAYRVAGNLFAPIVDVDVGPMADAIQMRAFELEVEELERLRAEQEARSRAQAEEQQRRMAEQAARLAKEEAAKAQAEAERRAAEEAARQQEQQQNTDVPPLELNVDEPIAYDPDTGEPIYFDPNALYLEEQAPLDLTDGLE
ncbi:AsmA family protein [Maritalea myrionectae]|uniref:AsmA family protein n=1 Tax=Maritalea myrionectae TaxID=454601 RepID=UPI000412B5E0|nr:AsmA family protein [Maritalea myrionectae]